MDERSLRIERRFAVPAVVAALLVIPIMVIEASNFGEPWETIGVVLNWATWLVFVAEAAAMLAVVPDRGRWLRTHPVEVAVVALTPPVLPALLSLRLLRALPALRRAHLARVTALLFTIEGLRYVALVAAVTAVGGGAAFAALEKGHSTADGIYWALTTMTTVGYGDLSPETSAGKLLAVFVMLVGTGAVTILTGAVAQQFLVSELEEETAEAEGGKEIETTAILNELRELQTRLATVQATIQRRRQP